MDVRIQKWGNSLAMRLPKALSQDAGLGEGTWVDVQVVDGAVVAKPLDPRYDLAELLDGVTKKNCHSAVDTGKGIGHEVW